jgi:hypothetical protein
MTDIDEKFLRRMKRSNEQLEKLNNGEIDTIISNDSDDEYDSSETMRQIMELDEMERTSVNNPKNIDSLFGDIFKNFGEQFENNKSVNTRINNYPSTKHNDFSQLSIDRLFDKSSLFQNKYASESTTEKLLKLLYTIDRLNLGDKRPSPPKSKSAKSDKIWLIEITNIEKLHKPDFSITEKNYKKILKRNERLNKRYLKFHSK